MRNNRQRWRGWLEIGSLVLLCGILGALQYRWIGEVSVAEKQRLETTLQSGLNRLSQEFNDEISLLCLALVRGDDADYLARLNAWRESGHHPGMLRAAYIARPGDSWWSLAEKVYGDGRLYRAVFAWNRALDPRVSLVAGTAIELPPRDHLEAAWPALMPTP